MYTQQLLYVCMYVWYYQQMGTVHHGENGEAVAAARDDLVKSIQNYLQRCAQLTPHSSLSNAVDDCIQATRESSVSEVAIAVAANRAASNQALEPTTSCKAALRSAPGIEYSTSSLNGTTGNAVRKYSGEPVQSRVSGGLKGRALASCCTACGKHGHSFDNCWYVEANHVNVNWDRTISFSASEIGKLYVERTMFSSLRMDVSVYPEDSIERPSSSSSSSSHSRHMMKHSSSVVDDYHANRASSRNYDHSYSSSNPDRDGHHVNNQQYRGDCERRADRTLYKHFPCTACGKYNHSYERCFLLNKNQHPYINFDRTVEFMQSDIGKQYARLTGCKSLRADTGANTGMDQYGREERIQHGSGQDRPGKRVEALGVAEAATIDSSLVDDSDAALVYNGVVRGAGKGGNNSSRKDIDDGGLDTEMAIDDSGEIGGTEDHCCRGSSIGVSSTTMGGGVDDWNSWRKVDRLRYSQAFADLAIGMGRGPCRR